MSSNIDNDDNNNTSAADDDDHDNNEGGATDNDIGGIEHDGNQSEDDNQSSDHAPSGPDAWQTHPPMDVFVEVNPLPSTSPVPPSTATTVITTNTSRRTPTAPTASTPKPNPMKSPLPILPPPIASPTEGTTASLESPSVATTLPSSDAPLATTLPSSDATLTIDNELLRRLLQQLMSQNNPVHPTVPNLPTPAGKLLQPKTMVDQPVRLHSIFQTTYTDKKVLAFPCPGLRTIIVNGKPSFYEEPEPPEPTIQRKKNYVVDTTHKQLSIPDLHHPDRVSLSVHKRSLKSESADDDAADDDDDDILEVGVIPGTKTVTPVIKQEPPSSSDTDEEADAEDEADDDDNHESRINRLNKRFAEIREQNKTRQESSSATDSGDDSSESEFDPEEDDPHESSSRSLTKSKAKKRKYQESFQERRSIDTEIHRLIQNATNISYYVPACHQ